MKMEITINMYPTNSKENLDKEALKVLKELQLCLQPKKFRDQEQKLKPN